MSSLFVNKDGSLTGVQPGFHPETNKNQFHTLRNNILSSHGEYPEIQGIKRISDDVNVAPAISILNRTFITKHPNKDVYAMAMNYYEKLNIRDSEGNEIAEFIDHEKVVKYKADELFNFEGKFVGTKHSFYRYMESTDEYIITFYLNNQNKELRIFDWNGNGLYKIELPDSFDIPMMVDHKRGWIYLRNQNNEGISRFNFYNLINE